jgi:hypothetical protein
LSSRADEPSRLLSAHVATLEAMGAGRCTRENVAPRSPMRSPLSRGHTGGGWCRTTFPGRSAGPPARLAPSQRSPSQSCRRTRNRHGDRATRGRDSSGASDAAAHRPAWHGGAARRVPGHRGCGATNGRVGASAGTHRAAQAGSRTAPTESRSAPAGPIPERGSDRRRRRPPQPSPAPSQSAAPPGGRGRAPGRGRRPARVAARRTGPPRRGLHRRHDHCRGAGTDRLRAPRRFHGAHRGLRLAGH